MMERENVERLNLERENAGKRKINELNLSITHSNARDLLYNKME